MPRYEYVTLIYTDEVLPYDQQRTRVDHLDADVRGTVLPRVMTKLNAELAQQPSLEVVSHSLTIVGQAAVLTVLARRRVG